MDKSKFENYAKMGKPPSGYNAEYRQGGWTYSPVESTKQDAGRLIGWVVVSIGCLVGYLVFSYVMGLVM